MVFKSIHCHASKLSDAKRGILSLTTTSSINLGSAVAFHSRPSGDVLTFDLIYSYQLRFQQAYHRPRLRLQPPRRAIKNRPPHHLRVGHPPIIQHLSHSDTTKTATMDSELSPDPSNLTSSGITMPSDSENYDANNELSSSSPASSSSSPLILYKPPTIWGLLRGAAINLLLPFVNGLMLGFGELAANEAAYRLGWSGTKVCRSHGWSSKGIDVLTCSSRYSQPTAQAPIPAA